MASYKFNPFTKKLDLVGAGGGGGTVTSVTAANTADINGITGGTPTDPVLGYSLSTLGVGGTFHSVTVDTKGRVTAGTNPVVVAAIAAAASTGNSVVIAGTPTNPTIAVNETNVGTAGTYSDVTTNAQGRVTAGSNINFINVANGAFNTGIISPSDTFSLIALANNTLRIAAIQAAVFTNLYASYPGVNPVKAFLQTDIIFTDANTGIASNGLFLRFVAINSAGAITFVAARTPTLGILYLGYVLLSRTALNTITFIDGIVGPRNVVSQPDMSDISLLERVRLGMVCNASVVPNANLTINTTQGNITGMSVNWGGAPSIHTKIKAATAVSTFKIVSPTILTNPILPADTTLVNPTQYWNGAAVVAVPAPANATVQRWIVSLSGLLYLQIGEGFYANLTDAQTAMSIATFTDLTPVGTFFEIARMAIQRNATVLTNNAQAIIANTGGNSGVGGGSSVTPTISVIEMFPVATVASMTVASTNNIYIARLVAAASIIVTKISFVVQSVGLGDTIMVGIYSANGGTLHTQGQVVSASLVGGAVNTVTVPAFTLVSGTAYRIALKAVNGSANFGANTNGVGNSLIVSTVVDGGGVLPASVAGAGVGSIVPYIAISV